MCGRKLRVPSVASFRPTQDRVREALGNLLVFALPGARFLDLFAGSGAVGLEAISRGAADVAWVEADRRNWRLIQENAAALGVDASQAYCADALKWAATAGAGRAFDIVFADPPYADTRADGLRDVMERCAAHDVVRPGGLFVTEQGGNAPVGEADGWEILKNRLYGKTRLIVWRRIAPREEPQSHG